MTATDSTGALFERLTQIIKQLRNPQGGCPWDLKQTHKTLKPYLIEESYETLDAIDHHPEKLAEELGDVLLQVVLHAQIGADEKTFTIDDVVSALTTKLIARHPHVFGSAQVADAEEVLKNWEKIKRSEKKEDESILSGVPRALPALLRAQRIGEKVGRVGFDWPDVAGVKDKVLEEVKEFVDTAPASGKLSAHAREEFGDLLFSLVQLGRLLGLNVEEVATEANDKFTGRFIALEKLAKKPLTELSREQLEALWNKVKEAE